MNLKIKIHEENNLALFFIPLWILFFDSMKKKYNGKLVPIKISRAVRV